MLLKNFNSILGNMDTKKRKFGGFVRDKVLCWINVSHKF